MRPNVLLLVKHRSPRSVFLGDIWRTLFAPKWSLKPVVKVGKHGFSAAALRIGEYTVKRVHME